MSVTRRQTATALLLTLVVLVTLLPGRGQQQPPALRTSGQQPSGQQQPAIQQPSRFQQQDPSGFEGGAVGSPSLLKRMQSGPQHPGEYAFARIIYDSPHSPYNAWFGGAWKVDYPEADYNFMEGIHLWASTNLHLASQPVQIRPTDPRIFDYPFVYIVEPGHVELTDNDAAALREYLLRGGFLMLDDFHGEIEWAHAKEQLKKIFPEYEPKDLPLSHAIFHSYFDLDQVVQVPGVAALIRGVTYEKGGITPHYMGIEDKNGRLMIFMTRNCDLGDAWEWINDPRYPSHYGLMAYKIGINVIVYAMSH